MSRKPEVGDVYAVSKSANFSNNSRFVIDAVRPGLLDDTVEYHYVDGSAAGRKFTKELDHFTRMVADGGVWLEPTVPAQPAAPKAPEVKASTIVKVGQKYKVRQGGIHPFSDGSVFEVTKIGAMDVHYQYTVTKGEHNRSIEDFESHIRKGNLTLQGPAVADPFADPFNVPEPMAATQTAALFSEQYMTKPLHEIDYAALEGHAMAVVHDQISKMLRKYIGKPASRATHEEILAEFRRTIDPAAGLSPHLQWDQQGNFAGLRLRQLRTGQSHTIKPSAPEPKRTLSNETDRQAHIVGLNRVAGETDEMLRDRIMRVLNDRGASRHKNVQEGIVGRTGAVLVDDEPTPAFFTLKTYSEPKAQTILEKPMTRIVNVFLMDTTAGLKAAERMIGKVENFASDARDNTTMLLELSMEHNLKEMLDAHNKRRKAIINQDILNRVGKTVYLQPIELKDVKIDIKVVTEV